MFRKLFRLNKLHTFHFFESSWYLSIQSRFVHIDVTIVVHAEHVVRWGLLYDGVEQLRVGVALFIGVSRCDSRDRRPWKQRHTKYVSVCQLALTL